MKKQFILLLITVLMVSCSSDDSNNSKSNSFNPPAWIQGKWLFKNEITSIGYNFKKDDISQLVYGTENSLKQAILIYKDTKVYTNVTEKTTDKEHEVSYTIASTTFNFHFIKVNENQIRETVNTPTANAVFTKQ